MFFKSSALDQGLWSLSFKLRERFILGPLGLSEIEISSLPILSFSLAVSNPDQELGVIILVKIPIFWLAYFVVKPQSGLDVKVA